MGAIKYRKVVTGPIVVAALVAVAGMAFAADEKLPVKDRLPAASLLLVATAWGFETSCGLPNDEDHALVMGYLRSDDMKQRDKRVVDAILTGFGAMMGTVSKDPSACTKTSLRQSIEKGAETGRPVLEYLIAHPGADVQK